MKNISETGAWPSSVAVCHGIKKIEFQYPTSCAKYHTRLNRLTFTGNTARHTSSHETHGPCTPGLLYSLTQNNEYQQEHIHGQANNADAHDRTYAKQDMFSSRSGFKARCGRKSLTHKVLCRQTKTHMRHTHTRACTHPCRRADTASQHHRAEQERTQTRDTHRNITVHTS